MGFAWLPILRQHLFVGIETSQAVNAGRTSDQGTLVICCMLRIKLPSYIYIYIEIRINLFFGFPWNKPGFHEISSGFYFEGCSNDGSPYEQTIAFHAIHLDVLNFSNDGMSIIIDFLILKQRTNLSSRQAFKKIIFPKSEKSWSRWFKVTFTIPQLEVT